MTKLKIFKRFIWFLIVIAATIAFSVELQHLTATDAQASETKKPTLTEPPVQKDIKFLPPKPDPAKDTSFKAADIAGKIKKALSVREPYIITDLKTKTPDGKKVKICDLTLHILDEEALTIFTNPEELEDNLDVVRDVISSKEEDDFAGYGLTTIKEEIILRINSYYNARIVDDITFEKLEIKSVELDYKQEVSDEAIAKKEMQAIEYKKFEILLNEYLQEESKKILNKEIKYYSDFLEKAKKRTNNL